MYASIRRVVAVCAVALVPFMGCSDDDGTGASAQADGAVANTSNRLIKMVMQGKGDKPEHRVKTEIRYKYDSNGCVTSFDYYYDGTGTLKLLQMVTYKMDEVCHPLASEVKQDLGGSGLEVTHTSTVTLDTQGRPVKGVAYKRDVKDPKSTKPELDSTTTTTYDSQGRPSEKLSVGPQHTAAKPQYQDKTIYSYGATEVTRVWSHWMSGPETNFSKYVTTLKGDKVTGEKRLSWISGAWEDSSELVYTYNSQGYLIERVRKNGTTNDRRRTYTYDAQYNLVKSTYYKPDGTGWKVESETTLYYGPGRRTLPPMAYRKATDPVYYRDAKLLPVMTPVLSLLTE